MSIAIPLARSSSRSISRSLQRSYSKVTFNSIVAALFANSELGFWYDPNDLSTMFQDSAGTTPVTAVVQPLGLVLDKSKGLVLGSELVINGDFSNGTLGWTAYKCSQSVSNKENTITTTTTVASYPNTAKTISCVIGKTYLVTGTVRKISGAASVGLVLNGINAVYTNSASNVNLRFIFTATLTTHTLSLVINSGSSVIGDSAAFSNISIKELPGNHAYQSTSSYRPLLQASPQRIAFDGIDDKLTTTLPAQLTGCTVIRAIPNVGCQILTNQTIPTTYNDSTSHCGLIVINRALTAYETSQITQLFNKLAGV